jgi:4-alpha-glucanotransferase
MNLIDYAETKLVSDRIKYDYYKEEYYKKAFYKFVADDEYNEFCKNEKIQEFATYMNLVEKEPKEYYLFLQFILDKQWNELKLYAKNKGVKIIGDMPIYPSYESAEVMFNKECYKLKDGKMEYVSGATPDEFNFEGQKWWNPLYNFEYMEKDDFKYLTDRYKEYLRRFDIVRIDHFRAFDSFYNVPIDKSARYGFYVEGPKEKFFDNLLKISDVKNYIVEDLGDLREETKKLRTKYNLTGMKILEYSLDLKNKIDLDENKENVVVYTSNHDSSTIVGWYEKLNDDKKKNLKEFLLENDCYDEKINIALIKYCLKSNAEIVVIPVQDILGLDDNSRINLPGQDKEENWSWKLKDFEEFKEKIKDFKI